MNPLALAGLLVQYRKPIALAALGLYHLAAGSPPADIESDFAQVLSELFGIQIPATPAPAAPQP